MLGIKNFISKIKEIEVRKGKKDIKTKHTKMGRERV